MFTETGPHWLDSKFECILICCDISLTKTTMHVWQTLKWQLCRTFYRRSLKGFVPSSWVNSDIMDVFVKIPSLGSKRKFALTLTSAKANNYQWIFSHLTHHEYVCRRSLSLTTVFQISFLLIWICGEISREAIIDYYFAEDLSIKVNCNRVVLNPPGAIEFKLAMFI